MRKENKIIIVYNSIFILLGLFFGTIIVPLIIGSINSVEDFKIGLSMISGSLVTSVSFYLIYRNDKLD